MNTINSKTGLLGIIGFPLAHSISPAMHNAAFEKLGLNLIYLPLPVKADSDRVKEAVLGLRALGFLGANVTVPHKRSVLPHLDRISDAAKIIGAVNTIKIDSGIIEGDNTDWTGFSSDLAHHGVKLPGAKIALIGTGGSARAIRYALSLGEAKQVIILGRNENKSDRLAIGMSKRFGQTNFTSGSLNEKARGEIESADLVVNCTPVGMEGYAQSEITLSGEPLTFKPGQVVYDMVYNPEETPFMRRARECNAKALSGLGMLVRQGAESLEMWTGKEAPIDTMFEAATNCLRKVAGNKDS